LAAIATLSCGFVVGVTGFLRFAQDAASANNELMLEVAARQSSGAVGGQEATVAAPVAMTMLAGLAFVIGTPVGWLALYLVLTGFVRCLAAAVGERRGDPIVGIVQLLIGGWSQRRRAARAETTIAALAGPEVADRAVVPGRLGIVGADLVIVASRPKPDWTPGTVLDCGDRWLTVGEAISRTLPVGLRTLYPLVATPEADVFRRVVPYELPPVLK
jgi:hypothetical protein